MNEPYETGAAEEHQDSLSGPLPSGPDDWTTFRLAQLTLLLEVAHEARVPIRTLDRLGVYDFLSANPFVVVSGAEARDESDRLTLRLAGFSDRQLSYASTGQRFISRRKHLQRDLSILVAYGVAHVDGASWGLTASGTELAAGFETVYADA